MSNIGRGNKLVELKIEKLVKGQKKDKELKQFDDNTTLMFCTTALV